MDTNLQSYTQRAIAAHSWISFRPDERGKQKELLRIEHKRLYYANKDFNGMDSKSILIMFKANLTLRTIEFHQFGIAIDYEKL